MSAALSDQELQTVQAQLTAHPEILQAFKTYQDWASKRGRLQYVEKGGPPNPQQVLKQYGINFPDIEDYQIQVDPQGNVGLKREGFFKRNMDWILPVATIATGGVANALAPGAAATDGVLPATQTVPTTGALAPAVAPSLDAAAGTTTATGMGVGGAAATTGGNILSKIGGHWKDILSGGADAVGAATDAAGKNRVSKDDVMERANRDYETALLGREGAEQKERNTALDNVYRNSWYTNRTPGPNNTKGITPMTPDYMATLGNLAQQGNTMLASSPTYGMTSPTIDPLKKFQPTDPSLMEKIGTYAGPIMKILSLFGGK